jgi:hypothetical protein
MHGERGHDCCMAINGLPTIASKPLLRVVPGTVGIGAGNGRRRNHR